MSGIEAPQTAKAKDVNWVDPNFDPRRPVRRWTHIKKWALILDIKRGAISQGEAQEIHGISDEEMAEWRARYDQYGPEGLKVTRRPWLEPERPRWRQK